MTPLEIETLARQAACLLTGQPPHGDISTPETLASLVTHHGLGALGSFQAGRHEAWRVALEGDALASLDGTVLTAKVRRHMVIAALQDALEVLVPFHPVMFKGLALAELYPKPHLRDPGDIDLIVPPDSFVAADDALRAAGWRLQPSVHRDRPEAVASKYGFARVWRHPARPVIVDLHRAPIDRTEPFWIAPEALFEHSMRVRLTDGPSVSTPGREEHLALIALHSVRHGTFRLGWCLDVHNACIDWAGQMDSGRFESFCRTWKILRAVRTGLEVSRQLFNTPWHPLDHVPLDARTERAAARRSPRVIAVGHLVPPGSWRRISALVDLMDDNLGAINYSVRTVLPPRELFATESEGSPGWLRYLEGRFEAGFASKKHKDSDGI